MDWLEEYGGALFIAGLIIFFGWITLSSSPSDSSAENYSPDYEYSDYETYDDGYEEESPEFYGYECSDDCSGHEAGYEWAENNGVCDEYFDGGNSESFTEGVRVYAEENCY